MAFFLLPDLFNTPIYNGADLLESFLCCIVSAQNIPTVHPCKTEARLVLSHLDRFRKTPELTIGCQKADLECSLLICCPSAPAQFKDDASLHLWNTLKEALIELEPTLTRHRGKFIPRTIDQIRKLLVEADAVNIKHP